MVEWYTRGSLLKQKAFKWGLFHVIVHASNTSNSQMFRFPLFLSKWQSCVSSKWQTRFLEPITWQKSHPIACFGWFSDNFSPSNAFTGIHIGCKVNSNRLRRANRLKNQLKSWPKEYFQYENQNRFYVRTSPVKSSKIKLLSLDLFNGLKWVIIRSKWFGYMFDFNLVKP